MTTTTFDRSRSCAALLVMIVSCGALLATAGGCYDMKQRKYELSVRNDTSRPVTLWLTKDGPPIEAGWRSPEDLELDGPQSEERIAGVVVEPGKVGVAGPVKGQFGPQTNAVLRVYGGATKISEILAIGRRSENRLDVVLAPGKNDLVVTDADGKLAVAPVK